MFYVQYLSSLCQRRQWPEPFYEPHPTRSGVKCVVRVNNREYHSDRTYESQGLATENAAMRAYLICRNFSVNDGRYPSGSREGRGVLQGMPVAIGTEKRRGGGGGSSGNSSSGRGSHHHGGSASGSSSNGSVGSLNYMEEFADRSSNSSGSRSGGSSPGSAEFPVSYRTATSDPRRRSDASGRVLGYGTSRRR